MVFERLIISSLINHQQVRFKLWRNVRPITGWPRPHLWNKGKDYPEAHTYNWLPYLPEDGQYTTRPLPIFKMGGRDLETGRVVVRTLGGGNKKKFRWLDTFRKCNDDGSVKEERVLMTKYDPLHTPRLALVADSEKKRWIFLTHGVEVGDIIRTHSEIPRNPVRAKNGDAHPVGALPTGTKIHAFEIEPGAGAKFCLAAGSSAEIVKRSLDGVTVKLPHGDQFKIDRECMAVVGQMSNVGHEHVQLWCPQRLRWLGKRPRSGQWHRKDGWCGRKIRPNKSLDVTMATIEAKRAKEFEERWNFDL
jgi:large subunit ribosomal protein L2